jgi:hypothetical protein
VGEALRFDMTLTRADFARLLPGAVEGAFREEEDGYSGGEGSRSWRLRLTPLEPLRAGLLVLERWRVDVAFQGWAPQEQAGFRERFLAGFQRGGG